MRPKIAYLIQAHEDPRFLKKLMDVLASADVRFFLHIDKKSNIDQFQNILSRKDTVVLKNRVDVQWGGWSQVQASINLIEAARASDVQFTHYSHISGNHFPLRRPEEIHEYYNSCRGEYINIVEVPNAQMNKDLGRFKCFYIEGSNRPKGFWAKLLSPLYRIIGKLPLRNPGRSLNGVKLFAGSNWWTLSSDAIEVIMQKLQSDPRYMDFFRYVKCSDESFFQTIIGNSHLREHCLRADVYTDWSNPVEAPCYITERHIDMFSHHDFLLIDGYGRGPANFARKFGTRNETVADEIVDRLFVM